MNKRVQEVADIMRALRIDGAAMGPEEGIDQAAERIHALYQPATKPEEVEVEPGEEPLYIHDDTEPFPIIVFGCPRCGQPRTFRTRDNRGMKLFVAEAAKVSHGEDVLVLAAPVACGSCKARHWVIVGTAAPDQAQPDGEA